MLLSISDPVPQTQVDWIAVWATSGEVVSLVANLLTIAASVIAIYLFCTQAKAVSQAFALLINWSFQSTLHELRSKLESLNDFTAADPEGLLEVRSILGEMAGQIRGNQKLTDALPGLAEKLDKLAASKRLDERIKRSTVAEIREALKSIEVHNASNSLLE